MIKNIIFDNGGVLATPRTGHWFITPNFWNILGIDEKEYTDVIIKVGYKNLNESIVDSLARDNAYNDDKYIFFEDVDDELEMLSKKYNLYMITDAWPSSFRVLDNKNISKYFKNIMVSSVESKTKLEGLFEIFLEKNRCVIPQDSIFIDDRKDILDMARQCGFNVLLMDRSKREIDYKIFDSRCLFSSKSNKNFFCDKLST